MTYSNETDFMLICGAWTAKYKIDSKQCVEKVCERENQQQTRRNIKTWNKRKKNHHLNENNFEEKNSVSFAFDLQTTTTTTKSGQCLP